MLRSFRRNVSFLIFNASRHRLLNVTLSAGTIASSFPGTIARIILIYRPQPIRIFTIPLTTFIVYIIIFTSFPLSSPVTTFTSFTVIFYFIFPVNPFFTNFSFSSFFITSSPFTRLIMAITILSNSGQSSSKQWILHYAGISHPRQHCHAYNHRNYAQNGANCRKNTTFPIIFHQTSSRM